MDDNTWNAAFEADSLGTGGNDILSCMVTRGKNRAGTTALRLGKVRLGSRVFHEGWVRLSDQLGCVRLS